jgi:hypothetical protein
MPTRVSPLHEATYEDQFSHLGTHPLVCSCTNMSRYILAHGGKKNYDTKSSSGLKKRGCTTFVYTDMQSLYSDPHVSMDVAFESANLQRAGILSYWLGIKGEPRLLFVPCPSIIPRILELHVMVKYSCR